MPSAGEELPPQDLRQLARDLHLAKLRVRQQLLYPHHETPVVGICCERLRRGLNSWVGLAENKDFG